jgi:flagellar basal-body rod protein FlgF
LVRGLYTSASGALVAESMADNVASNLANVSTGGFKQTLLQVQSTQTLDIDRIQTDPVHTPVHQPVGTLGMGSEIYDTPTDFAQGPLQSTGNPLDVAIAGDNAFFTVGTPQGVRYTRNGQFRIDGQGVLRTQDGDAVLSTQGQPIQLQNQGTVTIAKDGTITQNGGVIAQLQLTQFNSLLNLRPEGANNFAPSGNAGPSAAPAGGVSIQQGFVEQSNGNIVRSMVDLIAAERWFDANEKSIKTQDDATNTSITMVAKT